MLENHGSEEFERVFAFICSLKHVQLFSASEDVSFVAALSHVINRKIKTSMKELVWQPQHVDVLGKFAKVVDSKGGLGAYLCDHFDYVDKGKKVHIESIRAKVGVLKSLSLSPRTVHFKNVYDAEFEFQSLSLAIDEEELLVQMFTNPAVYNMLGVEACICYDICLAKGGTEAVVESFYSSMQAQAMSGGQDNETLALRTKFEWVMPPLIQADKFVKETAKIYIEGNKEKS